MLAFIIKDKWVLTNTLRKLPFHHPGNNDCTELRPVRRAEVADENSIGGRVISLRRRSCSQRIRHSSPPLAERDGLIQQVDLSQPGKNCRDLVGAARRRNVTSPHGAHLRFPVIPVIESWQVLSGS